VSLTDWQAPPSSALAPAPLGSLTGVAGGFLPERSCSASPSTGCCAAPMNLSIVTDVQSCFAYRRSEQGTNNSGFRPAWCQVTGIFSFSLFPTSPWARPAYIRTTQWRRQWKGSRPYSSTNHSPRSSRHLQQRLVGTLVVVWPHRMLSRAVTGPAAPHRAASEAQR
jgi:hypothetical protein